MKKGLIIGLVAGAAAAVGAALYFKKKNEEYCYCDDEFDDDFDCDCCGECCDCDDECTEIPADKAEDSVIMTDACVACGNTEAEAMAALDEEML